MHVAQSGADSVLSGPGDGLLFCSLPVQFTPASLHVVSQFFNFVVEKMYPARLGGGAEEYQYIYLRTMFPDEATECSIALMDATNAFFVRGGPQGPEGLQYYSRSLALVKDRLLGHEALSDSTLMLIILLILQEQMRQEIESARVHYEGLKKMIELRGGLDQLEDNAPMALKDVLQDAMDLATTLNQGFKCPEYKNLDLQMILVSVGSRLLKFQPLESAHDGSETDAILHLGLLLYMMTLFFQYDLRRVWEFPLVMRRLQDVLMTQRTAWMRKECKPLLLWTLLMGSIWALADDKEQWVVRMLQETANDMVVTDFDGVISCVQDFPWVHAIHDKPAHSLWSMIQG
ncbi:hypothetical protein E8E14_005616 [Neopestalotiopsis sp. 37M]|nr:hypothetical protein E8E14_005616 [Neopestalotiopsis sp. 37M]